MSFANHDLNRALSCKLKPLNSIKNGRFIRGVRLNIRTEQSDKHFRTLGQIHAELVASSSEKWRRW